MTKPWYKDGLKFACTECGKCCTGEPGYVWISQEEIEDMAEALNISVKEFVQMYTREVDGELSLKEFPKTYDCIFLRDGKCMVYKARPTQCRTFPFWPENVESKEAWEDCAKRCEGVNHEHAPVIPLSVIEKTLKENG
jgi:Fe-S-cluster containining protein